MPDQHQHQEEVDTLGIDDSENDHTCSVLTLDAEVTIEKPPDMQSPAHLFMARQVTVSQIKPHHRFEVLDVFHLRGDGV